MNRQPRWSMGVGTLGWTMVMSFTTVACRKAEQHAAPEPAGLDSAAATNAGGAPDAATEPETDVAPGDAGGLGEQYDASEAPGPVAPGSLLIAGRYGLAVAAPLAFEETAVGHGEVLHIGVTNAADRELTISYSTFEQAPPGLHEASWRSSLFVGPRATGAVLSERETTAGLDVPALEACYRVGDRHVRSAAFAVDDVGFLLQLAEPQGCTGPSLLQPVVDSLTVDGEPARRPTHDTPQEADAGGAAPLAGTWLGGSCDLIAMMRECFETAPSALGAGYYSSEAQCSAPSVWSDGPCADDGRIGSCILLGGRQIAHLYEEHGGAVRAAGRRTTSGRETCEEVYGGEWRDRDEPRPRPVRPEGAADVEE
jgi:hypothetical protein